MRKPFFQLQFPHPFSKKKGQTNKKSRSLRGNANKSRFWQKMSQLKGKRKFNFTFSFFNLCRPSTSSSSSSSQTRKFPSQFLKWDYEAQLLSKNALSNLHSTNLSDVFFSLMLCSVAIILTQKNSPLSIYKKRIKNTWHKK